MDKNKIIDCITFFDNNFIFELRYNILKEYVDYFVICESKYDHRNNIKRLNFDTKIYNSEKIRYFVLEKPFPENTNLWENQAIQREFILENLSFAEEFNVSGLKTGTTNRGRSFIGAAEYEGRTVFVITMGHMWKNSRGAKVGDSTRPRAAQSLIRTAYSLLDREAEIVSERVQAQTQAQNQTPEQQLPVLPNIY